MDTPSDSRHYGAIPSQAALSASTATAANVDVEEADPLLAPAKTTDGENERHMGLFSGVALVGDRFDSAWLNIDALM